MLCARDARDLEALRSDIALRLGVDVVAMAMDLGAESARQADVAAAMRPSGALKAILAPIGASTSADSFGASEDVVDYLVQVNLLSVVKSVGHLAALLDLRSKPVIVGFGSIAATRGRSRNIVYAASKRALQSYFEGLRHALNKKGVRVQFAVLGYMDTALSRGQKLKLPKASVDSVARNILDGIERDRGTFYLPRWWAPVCFALRLLPWQIFKKMEF